MKYLLLLLATLVSDTKRPHLEGNACMVKGATYAVQVKETSGTCGGFSTPSYTFTVDDTPSANYCDTTHSVGCIYQFTNCCPDRKNCNDGSAMVIGGLTIFSKDGANGVEAEHIQMRMCQSDYQLTFTRIK